MIHEINTNLFACYQDENQSIRGNKFGPIRMLKLRIDKDLGRYPFQSYTYNSDLNFSRSRI